MTGKRSRGSTVYAGVAPERMPTRSSELLVNRRRIPDGAARLEIGAKSKTPARWCACPAFTFRRDGF
jgi:hypothetical protein